MIRFNCNNCKQRYKTDDDLAGEKIDCKKCGAAVYIPSMQSPVKKISLSMPRTSIEPKKTEEVKKISLSMPKTAIGAKKTEEVKIPTLTLPDSLRKKMLTQ